MAIDKPITPEALNPEEEIINKIAEELSMGDEVEKERLIKRGHVLFKENNDLNQMEEKLRFEKESPIVADKHTAHQGKLETTSVLSNEERDLENNLTKIAKELAGQVA